MSDKKDAAVRSIFSAAKRVKIEEFDAIYGKALRLEMVEEGILQEIGGRIDVVVNEPNRVWVDK